MTNITTSPAPSAISTSPAQHEKAAGRTLPFAPAAHVAAFRVASPVYTYGAPFLYGWSFGRFPSSPQRHAR